MANYPDDWDNLRRYIYERDDYTCQKCGVIDVELHAHHINGRSHHPSNLVTLCRNCHADIHPHLERESYYGTQTEDKKPHYRTQKEYQDIITVLILVGMGIYGFITGAPVFMFIGIFMVVVIIIVIIIELIRYLLK